MDSEGALRGRGHVKHIGAVSARSAAKFKISKQGAGLNLFLILFHKDFSLFIFVTLFKKV